MNTSEDYFRRSLHILHLPPKCLFVISRLFLHE